MAEVPAPEDESEPTTITDGYFEEEFDVDAEAAGEFLVTLGEQLQADDEVLVTGEGWEIPFPFEDEVELEIEFEGEYDPELEIEVELEGRAEDDDETEVDAEGQEADDETDETDEDETVESERRARVGAFLTRWLVPGTVHRRWRDARSSRWNWPC
ncbi:hypothetical protein BRC81_10895 [Halobacteriales archaeon QS_1_68_20]|nr:MAG: hypothetical protein BRC81_10895 [Halobacteriales archaeon QS_1_68_20]